MRPLSGPQNPFHIQLSKSIRLPSRERAKFLANRRLADRRACVYCPLVQHSCYLYFFDLAADPRGNCY
jgi:hypothetical protein